jgi:hypothetical protein
MRTLITISEPLTSLTTTTSSMVTMHRQ